MPGFQLNDIIEFKDELNIADDDLNSSLSFLKGMSTRRYRVSGDPSAGGKGIGYQCVLLDDTDKALQDDNGTPLKFFVKIPKEGGQYVHQERVRYMNILKDAAINEGLTWAKLKDIPQLATVGFDRCVRDNHGVPFPKTAQRFLSEGTTLNEKIHYKSHRFQALDEGTFLRYALMLGELVAKIHNRRVIHGDIHPGNIFVTTKQEAWRHDSLDGLERFVLIDFGAAIFELGNDGVVNLNHEFRAPERNPQRASYVISEAIDVYSFGKILYVLATGLRDKAAVIEDGYEDNRKRRAYIRERLKSPYRENPCYLDILMSCCSFDPINRPSMFQVVAHLKRLIKTGMLNNSAVLPKALTLQGRIKSMSSEAKKLFAGLDPVTTNLFEMMVHEKIEEAMSMFSETPTTQAIIKGTRWDVISSLTMLIDQMNEGDSWTSLTTPEVWQGSGLGLDGRYMSSNILALRRNASIRRFMALSVDQLGRDWSRGLAELLEKSDSKDLTALSKQLVIAVDNTKEKYEQGISEDYRKKYRKMAYDYLCAWRDGISTNSLNSFVSPGLFARKDGEAEVSYREATGLHLGLIVFEDIDCLRESKKANALSLLTLGNQPLNVVTEMHGRLPRNTGQPRAKEPAIPSLVGFRLFKSLQPEMTRDRIIRFYDLVHRNHNHEWRNAVNIGPTLEELCAEFGSKLEL